MPSDDFDFEEGDRVRVRVRERGDSGNIQAKFDATVLGFRSGVGVTSDRVRLDPPWDSLTGVALKPHDAEFETLDS